jgi:hypothetical protein
MRQGKVRSDVKRRKYESDNIVCKMLISKVLNGCAIDDNNMKAEWAVCRSGARSEMRRNTCQAGNRKLGQVRICDRMFDRVIMPVQQ